MTETQVVKLLTLIASLDRMFTYRAGDEDAEAMKDAWDLALVSVDSYADARAAAVTHITTRPEPIKAFHVLDGVRKIQGARGDAAEDFDPDVLGIDPDDVGAYQRALREHRRRAVAAPDLAPELIPIEPARPRAALPRRERPKEQMDRLYAQAQPGRRLGR